MVVLAAAVLAAVFLPLLPPSRAGAAGDQFGVIMLNANPSGVARTLRQLGLNWWYSFDPGTDTYSSTNRAVMLKVSQGCRFIKSTQPSVEFADAEVQTLVNSRRGAYWLIGNEPNVPGQDDVSPDCYAQAFKLAVTLIKGTDATAKLVGPNILNWNVTCTGCADPNFPTGQVWLAQFISRYRTLHGVYPPVDVWGIHTYSLNWGRFTEGKLLFDATTDQQQIEGLRSYLEDPGHPPATTQGKPIWLTEFGVIWGNDKHPGDPAGPGTFQMAAVEQYVRDMVTWLKGNAVSKKIDHWFIFANDRYIDPAIHPSIAGNLNLMNGNTCTAQPTALGAAYRELAGTSAQADSGACAPPPPPPPSSGGGGGGGEGGATPTPIPPGSSTSTGPTASQPVNPAQGGTVRTTSVTVTVPPGVVTGSNSSHTLGVAPAPSGGMGGTSAPLPQGNALGSAAFTVMLQDGAGNEVHRLDKPLDLTVSYTDADVMLAGGDPNGLHLRRYDETGGTWIDLGGSVNTGNRTVTAQTDHLSLFGLAARLAPPTMPNPPGGSTLQSFEPLLTWSQAPGTAQYQVQVLPYNNDGPAINLIIGDPDLVAQARYQTPPPVFGQGNYILLPGMSYIWRVRTTPVTAPMSENDPAWSGWTAGAFRTPAVSSSTLSAVRPASASAVETLTPVLRWRDQNLRVFYYEVQVSADPQFVTDPALATAAVYWNLVHGGMTDPANSYAIPASSPLDRGTVYYWRVRPRVQGDGRETSWSDTWAFRTPD